MTTPGVFSPIEDVIAEAERNALIEWNREHQPCPHEYIVQTLGSRDGYCAECGAKVISGT